jgi:hypothetical protein
MEEVVLIVLLLYWWWDIEGTVGYKHQAFLPKAFANAIFLLIASRSM